MEPSSPTETRGQHTAYGTCRRAISRSVATCGRSVLFKISFPLNRHSTAQQRQTHQTQQRFGERIKQHVPRHILDSAQSTEKRRGRPPKRQENPEDYPSAIACHLAANKECCLSYDDSDFRVLARCRSKHHLNILEAMYIHVLKPVLCKQKSFVANLTLFKHAHSTHSHKHTVSSLSPMFTQAHHPHTFTQLSLSIILSSRSAVYIIVVLGLFFLSPVHV